jgi:hypothetical protein
MVYNRVRFHDKLPLAECVMTAVGAGCAVVRLAARL